MAVHAGGGGGDGSLLGSLANTWDALTDLGEAAGDFFVSEAEYRKVRTAIETSIDELKADKNLKTPPQAFGNSQAGAYLGYHTERAESHVIEMLQTLTEGLVTYKEAVVNAERRAVESDGNVAEWLTRLARSPRIVDGGKLRDASEDIEGA